MTSLSQSLRPECMRPGLKADNKEAVLRAVARLAASCPAAAGIRENDILEALRAREAGGTTGIGDGLAIPHCRLEGLQEFVAGILTVPDGVDFDSTDGRKVRLVVFVLGPGFERENYVQTLASISQALRHPHAVPDLMHQTTPGALRAAFLGFVAEEHAPAAAEQAPEPDAEPEPATAPEEREKKKRKPEWVLVEAFALVIMIGALLLALPISSRSGAWTNIVDALFTAASATCVTGLTVVDIGSYFSLFGQLVVLLLIQLGGLGIMTLGTFLLVVVGRRLSLRDEVILTDSLGESRIRGIRAIVRRSVLFAVMIELAGAAVLLYRFISAHGYTPERATYHAVFHAVSAFCNAGFSLYRTSLSGFKADPVVVITAGTLIVLGGLGFLVLCDLSSIKFWSRNLLRRGRLGLHSQMVLRVTVLLIVVGTLVFLALEARNTLKDLSWPKRIAAAAFHSVTPRTAGFNLVDVGSLRPPTFYWTMCLMFIGGAPGSTAGGIKVTTAVLLLATVVALVRGHKETVLSERIISTRVVREALTVFMLGLFCIVCVFGFLLISQRLPPTPGSFSNSEKLLFETVSAFGTVGLTTGITSMLSAAGKICIMLCMFFGRLGPLTIALVVGRREIVRGVRYPEEDVMVG